MQIDVFTPNGNTVALSVGTTTSRVALTSLDPYQGGTVVIYNDGPNTAFIAFGDSTVTAAIPTGGGGSSASGIPIASGATVEFGLGQGITNVAGICQSAKSATIYATVGQGS